MQSFRPNANARRIAGATSIGYVRMAVVFVALVAAGCVEPPAERITSSRALANPTVRAEMAATRQQYAWIGDMHAQAMKEVVQWAKENRHASKAEQCSMLFSLGVKYATKARLSGKTETTARDDSSRVARATQTQSVCSQVSAMSLFAAPRITSWFVFASAYIEPFYYYSNAMAGGFEQSAGDPTTVNSVINGVLVDAAANTSLSDDDFYALVAEADFLASSDNTWYEQQQYGAFGSSEIATGPTEWTPYSIFRGFYQDRNTYDWAGAVRWLWGRCNFACRSIGAQDALGFGIGWKVDGPTGAMAGGIGASGSTALGFLIQ